MVNTLRRAAGFSSRAIVRIIPVFLAWGILSALFSANGWFPSTRINAMIQPLLTTVLPILIAMEGGRMAGGIHGALAAAVAMIGLISVAVDASLLGALIIGPISGGVVCLHDRLCHGRIPPGLEMLERNLSTAVFGIGLCLLSCYLIAPVVLALQAALSDAVRFLIVHGLLPLTAVLIEPAKVLFLNNVINFGILSPLGAAQSAQNGTSILYMLETNPGPGLGLLLACLLFSREKHVRSSIHGALVIELIGGIHEMYFPYILMHPSLLVAPMAGNACAIAFYAYTGAGLTATPSPGSIVTYILVSPPGGILLSLSGISIGAAVSFALAAPLVRRLPADIDDGTNIQIPSLPAAQIHCIVFACDAGIGSSAVGASLLRSALRDIRPDIDILHASVDALPPCDLIICLTPLADRAGRQQPNTPLLKLDTFPNEHWLQNLAQALSLPASAPASPQAMSQAESAVKQSSPCETAAPAPAAAASSLFSLDGIQLGLPSVPFEQAIAAAANLLIEHGSVPPDYLQAMLERESMLSTCVGLGVSIVHGTAQSRGTVQQADAVLLQYPNSIDFHGAPVTLVFGLAAPDTQHMDAIVSIISLLEDPERLHQLNICTDTAQALRLLTRDCT